MNFEMRTRFLSDRLYPHPTREAHQLAGRLGGIWDATILLLDSQENRFSSPGAQISWASFVGQSLGVCLML